MPGRAASAPRVNVARFVGVLAILVGILLLQGSMCDGPTAAATPCVDTALVNLDADLAGVDLPDDHSGLMTLCLTVLMAVLVVLFWLSRPTPTLPTPLSTVVSRLSPVLSRAMRPEQLCVQRQ